MISRDELIARSNAIVAQQRKLFADMGISEERMQQIFDRPVRTQHWPPPVPSRAFDWSATMDGYEPGDEVGFGQTEKDAIAHLLTQMEDDRD